MLSRLVLHENRFYQLLKIVLVGVCETVTFLRLENVSTKELKQSARCCKILADAFVSIGCVLFSLLLVY